MENVTKGTQIPHFQGAALENGGQGRNRTADASLFRAALYQLSYLAWGTLLEVFSF